MMSKLLAILIGSVVAGTVPALAHDGNQPPPSTLAQKAPAGSPDERICRDVPLSGSRVVTKRFCATRAEWQAREQQDRDQTELMPPRMQCSVMGSKRC